MKKLYIVRHGETIWNVEGKTQGIQDSELTEKGMLQAKLLAEALHKEDIDIIYSSSLLRAKSTTEIISNYLQIPYYLETGLIEMNFGNWEGLTGKEIEEKYPSEFKKWRDEPHTICFEQGEGLKQAQKRVVTSVNHILTSSNKKHILIISHGTTIKLLLLHILKMNLCDYYKLKQDNCSINTIEFRAYGPVLLKYNDTCHIKATQGKL